MNIAAYCRVSTDKEDQLNSLEAQKEFCREAMERNQVQPTVPKRHFEPGMAPEHK